MSDMVEVVIDSIRVSLMSQQRIVILREVNADRYLPIWIGVYEAEAITIALQEVEVARPLTHDLLKNIFGTLNAQIIRVEVAALRDDTFYGNIIAEVDGKEVRLDIDSVTEHYKKVKEEIELIDSIIGSSRRKISRRWRPRIQTSQNRPKKSARTLSSVCRCLKISWKG